MTKGKKRAMGLVKLTGGLWEYEYCRALIREIGFETALQKAYDSGYRWEQKARDH